MDSRLLRKQLEASIKKEKRIIKEADKAEGAFYKEIQDAIDHIIKKYSMIFERLNKDFDQNSSILDKIENDYADYSIFSAKKLCYILSFILSYVEGETFIPIFFKTKDEDIVIVKDKTYYNNIYNRFIDMDELYPYYLNGDLIYLDNIKDDVIFCSGIDGNMIYSFGNYNYLKEFMNRLIQFRMEHDLNDDKYIDYIDSFVADFLLEHKELSRKNSDKRKKMLNEYRNYYDNYKTMTNLDDCLDNGHTI